MKKITNTYELLCFLRESMLLSLLIRSGLVSTTQLRRLELYEQILKASEGTTITRAIQNVEVEANVQASTLWKICQVMRREL